ncbi:hypothetical protein Acr_29g0003920 [Actinidia rufa]|uniref:Uncharacterized protein n=1 Tax=Actinidia rufa TaxID=165716 RepID=A0A7J0HDL9_9ERIC|nr:hypothetical protein Acr_29g0003920 [Actinidia rufa]
MKRARRSPAPELDTDTTQDDAARAKAFVTSEMPLFSELETTTALELGRGATACDTPEGYQGTKGVACTSEYLLTTPHPDKRRRQLIMGY